MLEDLLGARLDDEGEVLLADLLGLPAAEARNDDEAVLEHLAGQSGTVAHLQFLGVLFQHRAAGHDVFREDVTTEGDHSRVADDVVLENGNVGCSTADVDERNARPLLVGVQDTGGTGDGLERDAGHLQTGPLHAALDVVAGRDLAGDDVEVGFQTAAGHADRVGDALLHVHRVFLGNDVEDLVAGGQDELVHVADQPVDIALADLFLSVVPHQHAAVLEALDVLAGNAYLDDVDLDAGGGFGLLPGFVDGPDGFFDVAHDAAHDAFGGDFGGAENFQTAVAVASRHQGADFRGADIERRDDGSLGGVCHGNE